MQKQPLFSVVIPSYNHADFVGDALESVLNQTFEEFEVIIVDDGSTDDTRSVIAGYDDPRIHYVHQPNKGLPAARNTGIRHARAPWIALLDADDIWHSSKLEEVAWHIDHYPDIEVFGSPLSKTAELPKELPDVPPVQRLSARDFLFQSPFAPSAVTVARQAFDKVGLFDESLKSIEDRDMWLRLSLKCSILQIQSHNWTYRQHDGQMSNNCQRMKTYYLVVLRKFFRLAPEYNDLKRAAFSYCYRDAGICQIANDRKLAGIGSFVISGLLHPTALPYEEHEELLRLKMSIHAIFGKHLTRVSKRLAREFRRKIMTTL